MNPAVSLAVIGISYSIIGKQNTTGVISTVGEAIAVVVTTTTVAINMVAINMVATITVAINMVVITTVVITTVAIIMATTTVMVMTKVTMVREAKTAEGENRIPTP